MPTLGAYRGRDFHKYGLLYGCGGRWCKILVQTHARHTMSLIPYPIPARSHHNKINGIISRSESSFRPPLFFVFVEIASSP